MLAEVTFCISCYLIVLAIEYIPVLLKNRKLKDVPSFLVFECELHKLMPVLAALARSLSFFHQGSLGGLYGVLRGRPFAFREGLLPSGPPRSSSSSCPPSPWGRASCCWSRAGRNPYPAAVWCDAQRSRVSGPALRVPAGVYVLLKAVDTLVWINSTSPRSGFAAYNYYLWEPFGTWILFAEIVLCGLSRPGC